MNQNPGEQKFSHLAKTLLESETVDLTKTCRLPKTLLDFSVPAIACGGLQHPKRLVARTLMDLPAPLVELVSPMTDPPAAPGGEPLKPAMEQPAPTSDPEMTVPLPSRAEFISRARRSNYRAKTMLDRRAIAEMVEKFEQGKEERAAAAERQKIIDKELEDKISEEISDISAEYQPIQPAETDFAPLLIVSLILVTLSLLTFLALPANPSETSVLSQNVGLP
jgi:hypothetical protein